MDHFDDAFEVNLKFNYLCFYFIKENGH
jgi:hypothetical protein